MGLTTKSRFPRFQGPTQAVVPTPTFSGLLTDVAGDSINPYTSQGPGPGGAGQTWTEANNQTPVPAFSNVQALLNFNSGIADISQNAFALTNDGTTLSATTPFGTGQSGNFTTDKITYPVTALLNAGAPGNDFCAEIWAYPTVNTLMRIMGEQTGTGWPGWQIGCNNGNINFSGSDTNNVQNFGTYAVVTSYPLNVWYHIAVTREGSTWRVYINGNKALQITESRTPRSGQIVLGGWQGTSQKFSGLMDDFRFTKGDAVYTGESFTPPGEHPTS